MKTIKAKKWQRPANNYDTLAIIKDQDLFVDIIAYSIDRKIALCVARPRNIFISTAQQLLNVEISNLYVVFLKTDYFTLIVTEQFGRILLFNKIKLLFNENTRKIIAVFILSSVGWGSIQCNMYIPPTERSKEIK
jgi:predicted transcriptional regulator